MGDFPYMTEHGTFIINGAERVVVSQLVRSPGVYYTSTEDHGHRPPAVQRQGHPQPRRLAGVRDRGQRPAVRQGRPQAQARGDQAAARRRLRVERARWSRCSRRVDNGEIPYIAATLERDNTSTRQEALIEVYKKLRPGDPPTGDNAEKLVESLFFNFRRYDLGRVGRYKFNKKLGPVADRMRIELPSLERTITQGRHRGDRRPPHRAQQRPRPAPTTSTTSATAASAPSAS